MSTSLQPFPRLEPSVSQFRIHHDSLRSSDSHYHGFNPRSTTISTHSLASRYSVNGTRLATLEVYDLVYGRDSHSVPTEAVERLYESNAGAYWSCLNSEHNEINRIVVHPLLFHSVRIPPHLYSSLDS